MKFTLLGILSAFGLVSCTSPSFETKTVPLPAPAEPLRSELKRTLLLVADADRSLKLYRDILGFTVAVDRNTRTSGVDLPAGAPNAEARIVLLTGNDGRPGSLALVEWVDPPLISPSTMPTRLGIGSNALVFGTTNVDQQCKAIEKLDGIRFTAKLRTQVVTGQTGPAKTGVRGCNFFDADGIFVELEQTVNLTE